MAYHKKEIQKEKSMAEEKMSHEVEKSTHTHHAHKPSGRKERIPLGVPRKKLEAKPIDGYHLHWVNDYPGRVAEALRGGYSFVESHETEINDSVTPGNSDVGTRVKRLVGRDEHNGPLYAYLMKIEENMWKEDQEELQQRNNIVDEAIRRGDLNPVDRQYGSVSIKR